MCGEKIGRARNPLVYKSPDGQNGNVRLHAVAAALSKSARKADPIRPR